MKCDNGIEFLNGCMTCKKIGITLDEQIMGLSNI